MKFCVATLYSPDCSALAAVSNPNKRQYCSRHGYDLKLKTDGFDSRYSRFGWHYLAFERFRFFRECLNEFGLVLGCGADVLITNPSLRLEDIMEGRKPFVIAKDAIGFQTDVILVRRHPRSLELLDALLDSAPAYINAPFVDQTAFADLYPRFADAVEAVPQRVLNSFDYGTLSAWHTVHPNYRLAVDADGNDGQWQPGDFIFHCPGLPMHSKVAVLKDHLKMIQVV